MFTGIVKKQVDNINFKELIEEVCVEIVIELFSNEKDLKLKYFRFTDPSIRATIRGNVKLAMNEAITKEFTQLHMIQIKKCQEESIEYVKGEEFIDSIIARINGKQLTK